MKKLLLKIFLSISLLFACGVSFAAENLYKVTLLRASPGNLPILIEQLKQENQGLNNERVIMRHSQGDHWDLMLLAPTTKARAISKTDYNALVHFQHDFIASSGASWDSIKAKAEVSGLFHIEMFHAAQGRFEQLLQQRNMENQYLLATKRQANDIFITEFGSDVDCFTLGFYKDMQQFAASPDLDESVFEQAALAAGFKSRSDIGFLLREFIISHQDTLATRVH